MTTLILFNNPYGVLSQFTGNNGGQTLADYITVLNAYPAGRLVKDSEGLLLLTENGKLQQLHDCCIKPSDFAFDSPLH